jgi:hypothetical protein
MAFGILQGQRAGGRAIMTSISSKSSLSNFAATHNGYSTDLNMRCHNHSNSFCCPSAVLFETSQKGE